MSRPDPSSLHMSPKNPKVDAFINSADQWREETARLRAISLRCGLTEEFKWSKPCYSFQGANVVIIQGFKATCALMFCKGVLLKDPKRILKQPGESSQSGRYVKFLSTREIDALEPVLEAYIKEAIAVEKAGLKVEFKQNPEPVPAELQAKLDAQPALKKAFAALTPGRQRAYILYISAAKQSKSRAARVEKYIPQILRGEGINDAYLKQKSAGKK